MKIQSVLSILCLLLRILPQIICDLDSDREALLEFAAAVPHIRKLNWNDTLPVCSSWVGITCNKDGTHVREVRLPGIGLYGPIPSRTLGQLDSLRVLSLRSNHLNGSLPPDLLSIRSLQSLYLQHNNLSGDISLLPPRLSVVDLSFNSFTGEIPFKNLMRLSVLNLEFNSFSGNITNLDLPSLKVLNLSHNLLNGSIPFSLKNFPASSFIGNSHLCGPPLPSCSTLSPAPAPSDISSVQSDAHSRKFGSGAIIATAIAGCVVLSLLVLAIMFCCRRNKDSNDTIVIKAKSITAKNTENLKSDDFGSGVQGAEKNKLVFFEGCSYSFDLEDLLRASAEVLGKGTYGTAYKAVLDESTVVVVKRLREVVVGKKEFDQHMEELDRLGRHPNILPFRAYYFSKDEKLLVYEYMQASSLSAALHGNKEIGRTTLDWESRLRIALGAAKGIAHIHSEGGEKFTHGNIKSSNILLSADLNGRVSDFGLSPLMNYTVIKYRGAGYRAPETIETRKVTQKSDVYSFGVVLLEMLTGKSPIPYLGIYDDVVDLPRWVRSVVREEWTAEVFDVELMKYQNIEEELVQLLQIGLACVAHIQDMRPTMDEVVRMVEEIRMPELSTRPSSEDNRSKDSNVNTP